MRKDEGNEKGSLGFHVWRRSRELAGNLVMKWFVFREMKDRTNNKDSVRRRVFFQRMKLCYGLVRLEGQTSFLGIKLKTNAARHVSSPR